MDRSDGEDSGFQMLAQESQDTRGTQAPGSDSTAPEDRGLSRVVMVLVVGVGGGGLLQAMSLFQGTRARCGLWPSPSLLFPQEPPQVSLWLPLPLASATQVSLPGTLPAPDRVSFSCWEPG